MKTLSSKGKINRKTVSVMSLLAQSGCIFELTSNVTWVKLLSSLEVNGILCQIEWQSISKYPPPSCMFPAQQCPSQCSLSMCGYRFVLACISVFVHVVGSTEPVSRQCHTLFSSRGEQTLAFFSWSCQRIWGSYHITGLHFKKGYTHSGTSCSQCVYQICRQFFRLNWTNYDGSRYRHWGQEVWGQEVPEWVYAFWNNNFHTSEACLKEVLNRFRMYGNGYSMAIVFDNRFTAWLKHGSYLTTDYKILFML